MSDDAILKELRRIRVALETAKTETAYVDYATAAKMLCVSKRSVERLVSEKRVKVYDIAGPKLRVSELRALGDARAPKARAARRKAQKPASLLERIRAAAAEAGEKPRA